MSIQRREAGSLAEGHLAWGVLAAPDMIIVHGPLGWLHDTGVVFDVLLAGAEPVGPGTVERIEAKQADIVGLGGDAEGAGAIAVITLSHRSRYQPQVASTAPSELRSALEQESNIWNALERLEAVPSGVRDRSPSDVFGPIEEWEINRRHGLIVSTELGGLDEVILKWCRITRTCDCPSSQWWP
ncbi:hypothetical protein E0H73_41060 [Kribbella pittospori]|uniref:Uncharacterized protein n=1 Tax=Kribbella pittospori TaxID=722689 RepID=A0A4R0JWR6_9ACTN|nr:hypothetical protein [Kribbella pittospori]TCC51509.1 hypothetical protein E0H73_41060 [Kribbella pittospori]